MTDFSNIHLRDVPGDDDQDFYKNFREKLYEVERFPSLYTFKFILKSDLTQQTTIQHIFEHPSSRFSFKESSGGKYTSITVETYVNNPDEVIGYYKEVSKIDGIIML